MSKYQRAFIVHMFRRPPEVWNLVSDNALISGTGKARIGNPIVEIRRSYDRLISTMGFLYWYDDILILNRGPVPFKYGEMIENVNISCYLK